MALTSVQTQFFDGPGPLYAGQLADDASARFLAGIRSFRTETPIYPGRGVVKGTVNAQTDPLLTPYGVKAPLAGSVLADFVGICVRNHATDSGATSNEAITIRATQMQPIAELGSGEIIGAEVPTGITIVHGDPVYMSVSHATIAVGKFSNAAAAGLIAITGATWYGAAAAGTIGRIKL